MTDIVERIECGLDIPPNLILEEITSLHQQVRELTELLDCVKSERDQQLADAEALRVCADHDANQLAHEANVLAKQLAECQQKLEMAEAIIAGDGALIAGLKDDLAECQAREKVLREIVDLTTQVTGLKFDVESDSTALDTMLKAAKREALLDAAEYLSTGICENDNGDYLRKMAKELEKN